MKKPSRQYVWKHNGLRGGVGMVQAILTNIIAAPSTTAMAKHYAELALEHVRVLEKVIKERVDP